MRVLFDLLHPAHVHFFRHLRRDLLGAGHEVLVTSRDKDLTLQLLDRYGIESEVLSTQQTGRLGLGRELIRRIRRLRQIVRRERPDVLVGIMGPAIAPVGRMSRVPALVFYDTEHARRTNRWVFPMATRVITPRCYDAPVRGRHLTYPGYHELAYLHPTRFTPDPAAPTRAGLHPDEPYSILRLVSLVASHDIGATGIGIDEGRSLVRHLERYGRVLISSERPLPGDLDALRITSPPDDVHSLIAGATLMIGESATMCSEAAVLGVPAIHISDLPLGYVLEQQDRYGLSRYHPLGELDRVPGSVDKLMALTAAERAERSSRLLADTIDPTAWMFDYVTRRGWLEPVEPSRG